MTHTPGPWQARVGRVRLDGPPVWGVFNCEVTAPQTGLIATVWGVGDRETADAHLIAAAPEMLEVLEDQVELLEEAARTEMNGDGMVSAALSAVRDVIRKARGEL